MLQYDPEIALAMAERAGAAAPAPPLAVGDVQGRRAQIEAECQMLSAAAGIPQDVDIHDGQCTAEDGARLALRVYTPPGSPTAALVYFHGGGMICCSLDTHDAVCRRYASAAGVVVVAVDWRRAPEVTGETPTRDCLAALRWTHHNAEALGLDAGRIAVAGDSGGGGLAASTALLARDLGGPPIAAQLLVYPMLDDRTAGPDPRLAPLATWTYEDNLTGWGALLGDARGAEDVSPYAAAARADDLSGLPPTYLDVGGLDIFRDECLDYAARLMAAGVPVELHVYPGAIHAFELYAPAASVSKIAARNRHRFLAALRDDQRSAVPESGPTTTS